MDRRVWLFLAAAALALAVLPLTPGEYRWLNLIVVGLYVLFAGLFALNSLSERDAGRLRQQQRANPP
ncbi:MAG: hypothetical protein H0X22_11415 [Acidimicrobiia bacterium]|nr:hypothetical protein [Acidimicrobiia bacterium]